MVVWRCTSTGSGAPSAMTSGVSRMPVWCAGEARMLLWWVPRSNKLVGCAQHKNMDSRELGIHIVVNTDVGLGLT